MDNIQICEDVNKIIEKQEKEMQENLHTVGKLIYKIYKESFKLSNCLPQVFTKHLPPVNGVSFKSDNFFYSVELSLGQSITLTFKGKYEFTYREIKRDENSDWEICLSELDDKVHAEDIYATVWSLLEWLYKYSTQSEKRIEDMINTLKEM